MSSLPSWPRAIVFDLDGTVVDTAPDLHAALNRLLVEEDRAQLSIQEIRAMVGDGARVLVERGFAATGGWPATRGADALTSRFVDIYAAEPCVDSRLYEGVLELMAELKRAGVALGLCTNKPQVPTELLLEALELKGWFESVIGGDALDVRKPDPGHLAAVLDELGVAPADAVLVGDSRNDVAAARGLGVTSVVVDWGYTNTPPHELGADAVISSMSELGAVLRALAPPAA